MTDVNIRRTKSRWLKGIKARLKNIDRRRQRAADLLRQRDEEAAARLSLKMLEAERKKKVPP